MLPAQPNQSLIDGLEVLLALAGHPRPVGSRWLARQLGLGPTRVNRLLKTLAALGLARQDADRKYGPGTGMHVLSAMSLFGSGLVRRAMPELATLSRFGGVVALGVVWRDKVAYLYHRLPGMPEAQALGRAELFPATQSSIGLALLAQRKWEQVRAICPGVPSPFASMAQMRLELKAIREAGFAKVKVGGDTSIAVPVPGTEAAIAVSNPFRPGQLQDVLAGLRSAAKAIMETERTTI